MTAIVTQGDAAALPLPDGTVDLIVTSPPYFALRSYTDGGEHYDGQIGDEPTPTEYLDALITCTREWMRVLKPGGSIFVNLGDKYTGSKSLMGLPWRYAIRCTDELGLILRSEVIWSKPNGLPESIRDRVRRNHEQVFHFVRQPRYYAALDEIREPYTGDRAMSRRVKHDGPGKHAQRAPWEAENPLGKMPTSVWSIATQPLKAPPELGIDHFAAYPPELVRRIVLGWSPREVCTACGEGRTPIVAKPGLVRGDNNPQSRDGSRARNTRDGGSAEWQARMAQPDYISGYRCACPDPSAPATPGVVLDPFGGTGTTAMVADVHGRTGISVDLSHDYCRMARWRTTDEKQRARAGGPKPARPARPRPAKVLPLPTAEDRQLDLLDGEAS